MSPHIFVFDNLDKHACNDLKPHVLKERELFMSLQGDSKRDTNLKINWILEYVG